MAKLIAMTPCAGLLPVTIGDVSITELAFEPLSSVAPFEGKEHAVSERLSDLIGVRLPSPNRTAASGVCRIQWFGADAYLIRGDAVLSDLADIAAVTDQSDAWACVQIEGAGAGDVLARLVPIDLRSSVFKTGHTARTMLGHMSVAITCVGPLVFEIMVMRSMAGTLVHELSEAMVGTAARHR